MRVVVAIDREDVMCDRPPVKLYGILVTYRRPEKLRETLQAIYTQTRTPDALIVVDNAPSDVTQGIVEECSAGHECTYVPSSTNLGPAGGIALGMRHVLANAVPSDWLVLVDDDNPPKRSTDLERLLTFAASMPAGIRLAGVGLSGGRFDQRVGRVRRLADGELSGPVEVDVIAGGQLPVYRIEAVRDVGTFNERIFFGFEELEFCLRLRQSGYTLLVDGSAMLARRRELGRNGLTQKTSILVCDYTWRDYYSLRNLLAILLQHDATACALRVALTRGIAKAVVSSLMTRAGRRAVRWNTQAINDAFRGRLGRRLEPHELPSLHNAQ